MVSRGHHMTIDSDDTTMYQGYVKVCKNDVAIPLCWEFLMIAKSRHILFTKDFALKTVFHELE
jgi:hypothetical protein